MVQHPLGRLQAPSARAIPPAGRKPDFRGVPKLSECQPWHPFKRHEESCAHWHGFDCDCSPTLEYHHPERCPGCLRQRDHLRYEQAVVRP